MIISAEARTAQSNEPFLLWMNRYNPSPLQRLTPVNIANAPTDYPAGAFCLSIMTLSVID
jgi:hypothetical protein